MILVLALTSFVFLPYRYAEDEEISKSSENQALIDALENLNDATLRKIDYQANWQFIVDTETDYWFLNGETQCLMRLSVKDDTVRIVESIKGVDPNGIYVINRRDGMCFFASPFLGKVIRYGGKSVLTISKFGVPMALALDEANRALWVADGGFNQVVKLDLDGNIQERVQLASPPQAIAARADGGLWVATRQELQIVTADGNLTEPIKQEVRYLQAVPRTNEVWAGDAITGHVFHIGGDGSIIAEGGVKRLSGIVAINDGGCWLLGRKTVFALNPDGSLLGTVQGLSHPKTILFQPSDGSVWMQEGDNQLLRLYRPFFSDDSFLRIMGLLRGKLSIEPAKDLKWIPQQPSETRQSPKHSSPTVERPPPKPQPQQSKPTTGRTPSGQQLTTQHTRSLVTSATPKSEKNERYGENEEHYQGHWNLIPRDTIILMTANMTFVRDDNELIQVTHVKDIIPLLNQINISTADVTTLTFWGTFVQNDSNIDSAVLVTGQYQVKRIFEHLPQAGWKRELYGQNELYLNPQAEAEGVAGISDNTIALGSINALKAVLDVKHQKQATIWQRRDIAPLLRNCANGDAPITMSLLIPQDVFDMANAALTLSKSILSLFQVPVIGILLEKIGVAQALGVHISHQNNAFPVKFLCLMADEDAASFLSGTLNLLKASTSALPQDKMDTQSQEAMEIFRQMTVSREERLFSIQLVIPLKEFMKVKK